MLDSGGGGGGHGAEGLRGGEGTILKRRRVFIVVVLSRILLFSHKYDTSSSHMVSIFPRFALMSVDALLKRDLRVFGFPRSFPRSP
jgi:hypothetical protein